MEEYNQVVNGIRARIFNYQAPKDIDEPTLPFFQDYDKKFQRKLCLPKDISHKKRKLKRTIGSIASFDVISDIVSEFYQECKHKKAVDSFLLKSLVNKLKNYDEEQKFDPDLSYQQPLNKNNIELLVEEKSSLITTSDTLDPGEIEPK
mmetsp:Transcript_21022/g.20728  ORF Transcript_21022/g.20728 Transcript_21022/m.20728 type:complete len:148 (+) Transcript_21022:188-631(+)